MVSTRAAWHSAVITIGEAEMATLKSIQTEIKKLQQQAEALIAQEASVVIEKIRGIMEKHGLTTADIDAHVRGAKTRAALAGTTTPSKAEAKTPKYRDPKTGATWTGHGRAPAWIASVKNRDKYLVDASAEAAKPKTVTASKAKSVGNYIRGPQPALYRDPKSGATWSGRGRAPAWIADKDRKKFLIG